MAYADAPDAETQTGKFLERCDTHRIPCDSFHLSSGYSSIGTKRYVFTWNPEKFPDPARFARSFAEKGVHLVPNIKPCLLRDHPLLEEARSKGLLIAHADGTPDWVQFWDDIGVYLDFTNPDTLAWWKAKLRGRLLALGFDSTWNDNNEFEIVDARAQIHCFGATRAAREAKPLQSLLMMRASREAQKEFAPEKRPFVVSRSGMAGMQRYAQTWSGDNCTSWETLKYNIRMGLGLALSGVSNAGHDVGGFAGPMPGPELFARWVQAGIFLPRFSIHSWNDDGTANEPWMHPEVATVIGDLIRFRYRLMPYLYDCAWRHHAHFDAIARPTFYDFPNDPRTLEDCDEFMLGMSLLVAPVVEPGRTSHRPYLPEGSDWRDFWTGERFEGGISVTRPAPFDRPLLFAREGSAIALNVAPQTFSERGYSLAFLLFVPFDSTFFTEFFEDDGETENGPSAHWRLRVTGGEKSVNVAIDREGTYQNPGRTVRLILAPGDTRALNTSGRNVRSEPFEGMNSVVVDC